LLSVPVQVIAWRTVSKMTYDVSSGTLNLTHSLTHSLSHFIAIIQNRGPQRCGGYYSALYCR